MQQEVRIVVVGYGAIGRHHARNLAAIDGVELVGVVEPNVEAREEALSAGYEVFKSTDELDTVSCDGAVISVPTSMHEEAAFPLLERGCALLIEKPISHSLESAERIIRAARLRCIPLMVGYVERYNPAVSVVRDFVLSGNIGKIIAISARRVGVLPPRIKDANVLIDIGVHDIDMAAYLTDQRLELISALGGSGVLEDRLDYASLALDAGGISVDIETNWLTPVKIRRLSLTGTRGFVQVDYFTQRAQFAPGRSFTPTETYEALLAQYTAGELVDLPVEKSEPLRRELETFVRGIKGAELPEPEIALESLRIAEEATAEIEERMSTRKEALV